MPKTKLMHWIDVGMAAMVGIFIAILLFLPGEDYLVAVLLAYGAVLIVWAFLAESLAVRAEREQTAPASDSGIRQDAHPRPLPH